MKFIVLKTKFFYPHIIMFGIVFVLFKAGFVEAQDAQRLTLKKVVIDPGHGGRDPGALGSKSKEKDIVLDIALRVGKKINEKYPDVEVIYTRKTDVFIDLYKRGEIANKAHADLFISIHVNAAEKKCPAGTETFVMGSSKESANLEVAKRENAVILLEDDYSVRYEGFDPKRAESYIKFELMQSKYKDQSIRFAAEIQEQFRSIKRIDRNVKEAPHLVLWYTAMPSVLVELGFICNTAEENYITSATGKEQLANSIFSAFSSYKSKIDDRSLFIANEQPDDSQKVEFCIQIATSSTPKETNPDNFKKYKGVERFKISENTYKYIVERTSDYEKAQENLKKVRADFVDAFIVCIVDGKIVNVAEGQKLLNQ